MEISAYSKRTRSSGRVATFEHHVNDVDVAEVTTVLPGNRTLVVKFKDGVEPKAIISDELLQRIVGSAFKAGVYRSWALFSRGESRSLNDPAILASAVRNARKVVKRSNNKKG